MALPFKDRVVQWAIYRVLNPYLERRYILDSYACRVGFGTHRAADRLQYWVRRLSRKHQRVYVLKLDISKYFYRVDHDILIGILRRMIADKDLLWLLETIIRCDHTPFGVQIGDHNYQQSRLPGIGMPIGNLTSQMFANLYLNELDQYAKHVLKIRHYIRYMDDIVILHPSKKHLWKLKRQINDFLEQRLRLALNNKTSVRAANQGIDFCGYRIWPGYRKLRKGTALKMRHRLRYLQKAYARGDISLDEVDASMQSYMGLMKHCNSYGLRRKIAEEATFCRQQ